MRKLGACLYSDLDFFTLDWSKQGHCLNWIWMRLGMEVYKCSFLRGVWLIVNLGGDSEKGMLWFFA